MKSIFFILVLLSSSAFASIHYGDCIKFTDDFYGEGYGIVIARDNTKMVYEVYVNVFLTLNLPANELEVVDEKFCKEEK